ncbi:dTDP-4-dehydrorhamnose 3,5-epimerase [Pusillimonas sp.]|uniref:dTDP-4-dehydrorhamnose 3,5-epimerase n=1 Tax=Pusillimonas sp. TaxID=3040095 RepID=UPI0037C5D86B
MPLQLIDTAFPDIKLVALRAFADERGYFLEGFRAQSYQGLPGQNGPFVQDNFSHSTRGVLRGLHFQHPNDQGKLVRAVQGSIYDVTVDIRVGSPTFGQWQALTLSHEQPRQLWIPPGYAHGFLVLSDEALVEYKCTAYYAPQSEGCLRWNDPNLGIDWPCDALLISDKDRNGKTLKELLEAGLLPSNKSAL